MIFPSGQPADSNFRRCLIEALDHVEEHQVLFGMGQQYTMLDMNLRPLGWPHAMGYPAPEGPYCYGVGADRVIGRDIAETLFRAALYAGIEFTGSIIGKYLGMVYIFVIYFLDSLVHFLDLFKVLGSNNEFTFFCLFLFFYIINKEKIKIKYL